MSKRGSYWAGTGTHQAEFKRLRTALVTVGRTAETPDGQLLRAVAELYQDLKRHGLRNIDALWGEWRTVDGHRDRIAAAIGPQGTWVMAVVERAVADRRAAVASGGGGDDDGWDPDRFPLHAFEALVDGCVLAVAAAHLPAA